ATRAAAGVLAPDPETKAITELALRSSELWPAFAAELGDVGYTRCGSLVLAFGDETSPSSDAEWVDRDACLALEPGVTPDCSGAWHLPRDAQVDPRRVVGRLVERVGDALHSNADVVEATPEGIELADGRRLARRLPVRPVKGQTLRLRGRVAASRIIRSEHVYVVPRAGGETVLGATIEDAGFDTEATAAATQLLLRQAVRAVPAVAELELVEELASLRPGTPDDGPLIGE